MQLGRNLHVAVKANNREVLAASLSAPTRPARMVTVLSKARSRRIMDHNHRRRTEQARLPYVT